MKARLRRPRNALVRALPWVLGVAVAAGCFGAVFQLDPEPVGVAEAIASGAVGTAHVEAVERSWIDDAFPAVYLPAPVTDLPCPTGVRPPPAGALRISEALAWVGEGRLDDAVTELAELDAKDPESWLAGLTLGMLLAREGRLSEAETVLASVYGRRPVQATVRGAVEAARNQPRSGPASADVRGAVHLLHAYGYVLIETHRDDGELWHALRNPIGCAKLLALRGDTDRMRRLPTWDEHRLAAPGCGAAQHGLTTLDLYNNLIVGYLEHPDFRETPERRQQEFERAYRDPPHENPLLAVLRSAAADFPSERWPAGREHWLWAVSNAERLLKQRRESAVGELGNVRLAYNLAALMESALPASPPEARAALHREKNELLELAVAHRAGVLPRQMPKLHRGLARLKLLEAVRSGTFAALPAEVTADLDGAQTRTLADVTAALARRSDPAAWLAAATSDAEVPELGGRTAPWREASRRDLAAALGFWWRISPRRLLSSWPAATAAAAVAGMLAWTAGAWLAVQLGRRRDLLTSFYRHEARRRLREIR